MGFSAGVLEPLRQERWRESRAVQPAGQRYLVAGSAPIGRREAPPPECQRQGVPQPPGASLRSFRYPPLRLLGRQPFHWILPDDRELSEPLGVGAQYDQWLGRVGGQDSVG